jgi:hypothetical protein
MNHSESYSHDESQNDGINLYDVNPSFAAGVDEIIESEPDESNWRSIMHKLDPEMTGKIMLDSAETFIDVEERLKARSYIMEYRAEISRAVQKAIENGTIRESEAESKVEEIFGRPLTPEGQEILM